MSSCGFKECRDLFGYWRTASGKVAVAMCAMIRENGSMPPAWVPKSYQCSALVPSGPGSLSRGMRLKVIGINSMTSAVNMCETWAVDGMAGSGCDIRALCEGECDHS